MAKLTTTMVYLIDNYTKLNLGEKEIALIKSWELHKDKDNYNYLSNLKGAIDYLNEKQSEYGLSNYESIILPIMVRDYKKLTE